jgi:RNA polymerase sigma-70 factor (ECF subfamily)
MVLRRCRSLLNDEDQALDAMQDVFVKVLRRKDTLRPDHPSSLLYRIATNTCLNEIKKRKRGHGGNDEQALQNLPGRDDPEGRILDACLLEQLFDSAKPGTRFIAEIYYLREATLAETARETGLSVSGVRKRLQGLRTRGLRLMTASRMK